MLIPTSHFIRTLVAARLAADVAEVGASHPCRCAECRQRATSRRLQVLLPSVDRCSWTRFVNVTQRIARQQFICAVLRLALETARISRPPLCIGA